MLPCSCGCDSVSAAAEYRVREAANATVAPATPQIASRRENWFSMMKALEYVWLKMNSARSRTSWRNVIMGELAVVGYLLTGDPLNPRCQRPKPSSDEFDAMALSSIFL